MERVEKFDGLRDKVTSILGPIRETELPIDRLLTLCHYEGGKRTEQLAYCFVGAAASAFNTLKVGEDKIMVDGRDINASGSTLQLIIQHTRSLIFAFRGKPVLFPNLGTIGKDGNQTYDLRCANDNQSFNLWTTQMSASDDTVKAIFSDDPKKPPSTSICKPIPELAVRLAAQTRLSCVVPLNGQLDDLRRRMGLMITNSKVKFPATAPMQGGTRRVEYWPCNLATWIV